MKLTIADALHELGEVLLEIAVELFGAHRIPALPQFSCSLQFHSLLVIIAEDDDIVLETRVSKADLGEFLRELLFISHSKAELLSLVLKWAWIEL